MNGMKFSSEFNSTDCGCIVKAMFVDVHKNLVQLSSFTLRWLPLYIKK